MRKYLKLLSNKIKMPFQFWSKAIRLKLQFALLQNWKGIFILLDNNFKYFLI